MPDRDPPIEPQDEFSELAKQLGDALDADADASSGAAVRESDEVTGSSVERPEVRWAGATSGGTEANDPTRWEREYTRTGGGGGDYPSPFPDDAGDDQYLTESNGAGLTGSVGGSQGIGDRLREQRFARSCATLVLLLILLVVVSVVSCLTIFDGDGDGELVGGGGVVVSPTASESSTTVATATAEPTENPLRTGEDVLDALAAALDVLWTRDPMAAYFFDDLIGDFLDSISGRTPTFTGPSIDIRYHMNTRLSFDQAGVDTAFNRSIIECGQVADGRTVVCADDVQPMPAGEVLVFAMLFAEEVPQASEDRSFIFSAVFDSDGEPANDWQFNPPFDFDLFQGADRWYQLIWDHNAQQWFLGVTQVDASQSTGPYVGSAARVVVEGDTIVFFIPASEFDIELPPYRLTSFGHDGAYSESDRGADVSGVDPTEPLQVPSADVQPASP